MSYKRPIDSTGGWDTDLEWVSEQQNMFENPTKYGMLPGDRFTLPLYLKQKAQPDLPGDIERVQRRLS